MTDAPAPARLDGGGPPPPPGRYRPPVDPRTTVVVVSGFVMVMLAALIALIPVPFATYAPGPIVNVLGSVDGKPMIDIPDRQTYDTTGQLDLTTVYVSGGPRNDVSLFSVVRAWFDPTRQVVPEEVVFPAGVTQEQYDEQDAAMMTSSQESAHAAAMAELGIKVPTALRIAQVAEDAPARGVLQAGDVVLAVGDRKITDLEDLRDAVAALGSGGTTRLTVTRDGKQVDLPAVPTYTVDGRVVLGVSIAPKFDFPFAVNIRIDQVGGPSAGTMFALGIIDKLTPGALTGGANIAGTGAIDSDGVVEPIGGIQQKMVGARSRGADWFLAPAENCDDVREHVPDGLRVVRISTLHQAHESVKTIGGTDEAAKAALPTC